MSEAFRVIQHQLALVTEARDAAQRVLMEREEAVSMWQGVFEAVRASEGLSDDSPMHDYGPELFAVSDGAALTSDGSAIVHKPVKYSDGGWEPECTGRLVSGTGCGHCLRCSREWHALQRSPHEFVNGSRDIIWLDAATVASSLKFGDGKRIETVHEFKTEHSRQYPELFDKPVAVRETVQVRYDNPTDDENRVALERWCREWNEASKNGNRQQMTVLEAHLRKMTFPPNVQLSWIRENEHYKHGKQVIIDVTPAESGENSS